MEWFYYGSSLPAIRGQKCTWFDSSSSIIIGGLVQVPLFLHSWTMSMKPFADFTRLSNAMTKIRHASSGNRAITETTASIWAPLAAVLPKFPNVFPHTRNYTDILSLGLLLVIGKNMARIAFDSLQDSHLALQLGNWLKETFHCRIEEPSQVKWQTCYT